MRWGSRQTKAVKIVPQYWGKMCRRHMVRILGSLNICKLKLCCQEWMELGALTDDTVSLILADNRTFAAEHYHTPQVAKQCCTVCKNSGTKVYPGPAATVLAFVCDSEILCISW